MLKLLRKWHIVHTWSKWEKYERYYKIVVSWAPGQQFDKIEWWQRRHCAVCGRHQERRLD